MFYKLTLLSAGKLCLLFVLYKGKVKKNVVVIVTGVNILYNYTVFLEVSYARKFLGIV